jgi:hypothetical protein
MRRSQAKVRLLARVVGIGIETTDMLVHEVLTRRMRDRKAVARYAGLRVRRTKVALAGANKGLPEPATPGSVVVWSSSLGAFSGFRRAAPWHCGIRLAPPTAVQVRARR